MRALAARWRLDGAPRHAQWRAMRLCGVHRMWHPGSASVAGPRVGPWRVECLVLQRAVVASHPLKPAIQQRTRSDERWARAENGDCLA